MCVRPEVVKKFIKKKIKITFILILNGLLSLAYPGWLTNHTLKCSGELPLEKALNAIIVADWKFWSEYHIQFVAYSWAQVITFQRSFPCLLRKFWHAAALNSEIVRKN